MSTRLEILRLASERDYVTTTMLRGVLTCRWSGVPVLLTGMVQSGELARIEAGRYALPEKAAAQRALAVDSEAALRVFRALEHDKQPREVVWAAAAEVIGEANARTLVTRLVRDGFLVPTNRQFLLSPKGAKKIPRGFGEVVPMRPYVPPKSPPRRPGSMQHLALPSVFARAPS